MRQTDNRFHVAAEVYGLLDTFAQRNAAVRYANRMECEQYANVTVFDTMARYGMPCLFDRYGNVLACRWPNRR
jgi:hypothetical protein